jgi:hypothetical protein
LKSGCVLPYTAAGDYTAAQQIHSTTLGRPFTDGLERDVYEDDEGRQYVLDGDGERVYGQWLWPADEPYVVTAGGLPARDLA